MTDTLPSFGPEGRYAPIRVLGRGGMGSVYLAEDRVLRRRVAVKVIGVALQGVAEVRARFRREARVMGSFRHPNLPEIYEVDLEAKPPFLVMEYLEGEDFDARLARCGPLPVSEVRDLLRAAAEALAYLHERRVVHRDIKPSNLFLGRDGRVRLMDFGLALPQDLTRMTAEDQTLGTPLYLPPEVLGGKDHGPAGDVYQLALVAGVLLTGRNPYDGYASHSDLYAAIAAGKHRAHPFPERVPADLRRLLAACWALDPAARPRDGRALAQLLGLDLAGAGPAAPTLALTPAPATPLHPRPRAPRWGLGAPLALAVAVALAGALVAFRRPAPDGGAPAGPPAIDSVAREFCLLPRGVHLVLGSLGDLAPRWRFEARDGGTQEGALERHADGWRLDLGGLQLGHRGRLLLVAGGVTVAASEVVLPPAAFVEAPTVRVGKDWLALAWRLHGRAAVAVTVEDGNGLVLARASAEGTSCLLELPGRRRRPGVRWRLGLGGSVLWRGVAETSMSRRFTRSKQQPSSQGVGGRDMELLQGSASGRVLAKIEPGTLLSLAPSPGASGTVLREEGSWSSGNEGEGGGLVLAWADGERLGEAVVVDCGPTWTAAVRRVSFAGAAGPEASPPVSLPGRTREARLARIEDGRWLVAAAGDAGVVLHLLARGATSVVTSVPVRGARVAAATPAAGGALVVSVEGVAATARWVRVTGDVVAEADDWPLAGSLQPPAETKGAGLGCVSLEGGDAALAVGSTAYLLRPGQAPAERCRAWPLDVGREPIVCSILPLGKGAFVVATVERTAAVITQFTRLRLHRVDPSEGPDGSVVTTVVPSNVMRPLRLAARGRLSAQRGLLWLPAGFQLFAFREEGARFALVDELWCLSSVLGAPVAAGGALWAGSSEQGLVGVDLRDDGRP